MPGIGNEALSDAHFIFLSTIFSFSLSLFSLLFSVTLKIPAKLLYASQIPDQNLLFHFYNVVLRIDATPHCFHSEGSDLMRNAVRCRPKTEQNHSMRA